MSHRSALKAAASLALSAGMLLGVTTAASAQGGGSSGVRTHGSCTGTSTWALHVKPDNGAIEVELEVDETRNGVRWDVLMGDNNVRVFTGSAVTSAPSGSFTVRRLIADRAGVDHIVARATSRATGEVCRGTANL
ncbi:MAG: hypothetical protein JWN46_630 [Acidimicrobiales bacterium]|nr:hypothetical protein [Acidimicrobiales bacterium]